MALAQQQKSVVVVGAGPAGCTAAAALACRGYRVRVFEQRPEPLPVSTPSNRLYPMMLGPRSLVSLDKLGVQIKSVGKGALPVGGSFVNGKPMGPVTTTPPADTSKCRYLVDRQLLGYELYRAAQERDYPSGGSIEWFWGHGLEGIDFGARTALFAAAGGAKDVTSSQVAVQYDMLVGADGSNSAVRQAMVKKLPEVRVETPFAALSTYKTFHNLPVCPEADKLITGVSEHPPRLCLYPFFAPPANPLTLVLWKARSGTMSGMMSGAPTHAEASLRGWVSGLLPTAPPGWVDSIVEQTREGGGQEVASFGQIVRVSQYHGPSCVLLGDSAHSVTSTIGQGCSLAMESVLVLMETLDRVGLEEVPAAFSAARVKDAHAFQTIEFNNAMTVVKEPGVIHGEKRLFSPLERALASLLLYQGGLTGWLMLKMSKQTAKTALVLMPLVYNTAMPWSKVLGVLVARTAALLAGAVALLAGLGSLAAALLAAGRAALVAV